MAESNSRLRSADQVQHHGLRGHVQGGGGLVHDEERRVGHEGHGDDAALEHPAGELVGVAFHDRFGVGHGHLGEHLDHPRLCATPVHAQVQAGHLGQLLADLYGGVQRAQGALVDHADVFAPEGAQVPGGEPEELHAVQAHAPRSDPAVLGQVSDGAHGQRRLARARFPHQTEALVLADRKGDVADHLEDAAFGLVLDAQPFHLEHGPDGFLQGQGGGGCDGGGGCIRRGGRSHG